jgi:hypothetical protein
MVNSDASLSGLPVELLDMVAGQLESSDFFALRLTSKTLTENTYDLFSRTYFQERCFILTDPTSMNALLSISQHNVFGKSLKKLWLVASSLVCLTERGCKKWVLDTDDPISALQGMDRDQRLEKEGQIENFMNTYERLAANVDHFQKQSLASTLVCILRNFILHGNAPSISKTTIECEYFGRYRRPVYDLGWTQAEYIRYKPYGLERLRRVLGAKRYDEVWDGATFQPIYEAVFKAIVETEFPAQKLTLGDRRQPLIRLSSFSRWNELYRTTTLRSLRLNMYNDYLASSASEELISVRQKETFGFLSFLASARNIEHFYFELFDCRDYLKGPQRLFQCIASKTLPDDALADLPDRGMLLPNLRSLELVSHRDLSLKTLLHFLQERQRTLTEVLLRRLACSNKSVCSVPEHIDEKPLREALEKAAGLAEKATFNLVIEECYT